LQSRAGAGALPLFPAAGFEDVPAPHPAPAADVDDEVEWGVRHLVEHR
jgi:hypothetical protein